MWPKRLTSYDIAELNVGSGNGMLHNTAPSHHLNREWLIHDDVIKWKHFPRYWPFVRGIHRPPANSPYKGQRRGVLLFSLICAVMNGFVNNDEAGDLIRHRTHYYVIVMISEVLLPSPKDNFPASGHDINLWIALNINHLKLQPHFSNVNELKHNKTK